MVGNGCTDWTKDTLPAMIDMLYQHHVISDDMYQAYSDTCLKNNPDYMLFVYTYDSDHISGDCVKSIIDIMNYRALTKVNPYHIYGKCYTFEEIDLNETTSSQKLL